MPAQKPHAAIPPPPAAPAPLRPSWRGLPWLLVAGAFAVYAVTLCPTLYVGDSPELALAAASVGVPHPPGYPLHTLLSAAFVHALPCGSMAWRANVWAALVAAAGVGLLCAIVKLLGASRAAAAAAAWTLAFGATYWAQAVAVEVYGFDLLLLLAALHATLRAAAAPNLKPLAWAGLTLGLWVGHRPTNVLLAAGLGWFLLHTLRQQRRPWRGLLPLLLAGLASASVYLALPILSARQPPLDIGDPQTWPRFWTVVSAETYQRHLGTGTAGEAWGRVGQWLLALPANLGAGALAGPIGLALLWRRRRALGLAFLAVVTVVVVFAAQYNILDIAPYFLPAHAILALGSALAYDTLLRRHVWLAVALALPLPWLNLRAVDLSRLTLVEDHGRALLTHAAPDALLLTSGDTSTHALWYLQAVEQLRPDVIVVSPGHAHAWYVEQLKRRHPDLGWPPVGLAAAGSWVPALLQSQLGRRTVYLLEPAELRLPALGLGSLLEHWRSVPQGPLHRLVATDKPPDAALLAQTVEYFAQHPGMTAAQLEHADVQVLMTAFHTAVGRFSLAAALLEVGDTARATVELQALARLDPDRLETRMAQAYSAIGRRLPGLRLGERAQRSLAAAPGGAPAMLRALAGAGG